MRERFLALTNQQTKIEDSDPASALALAFRLRFQGTALNMKPKRTILCVDDNEQSLSIRKVMLETRGYRVIACCNGRSALEVFECGGIDLVLSDLVMPDLDGT